MKKMLLGLLVGLLVGYFCIAYGLQIVNIENTEQGELITIKVLFFDFDYYFEK